MKKWLLAVVTAVVLAACGDTDTAEQSSKTTEQIIEEGTIGFEVLGDSIEEATNVPEAEKAAIIAAFNEYIDAFNSGDAERYGKTTAVNAVGFDYEQDVAAYKEYFEQYDYIIKTAEDVTITKYSEDEVQLYANVTTKLLEAGSDEELSDHGRQVTVFVKEDGAWKVTSIHYIGNMN
ncbi:nuclear transport factor 2 family protein [Lysinibacillus sp. LZ02]|uniref:nuclear transport factor 2 family protein n=1 Tax=Lysinibacillus sp. LZ02 TaxID=3420668 RepID=UPI003D3684D1